MFYHSWYFFAFLLSCCRAALQVDTNILNRIDKAFVEIYHYNSKQHGKYPKYKTVKKYYDNPNKDPAIIWKFLGDHLDDLIQDGLILIKDNEVPNNNRVIFELFCQENRPPELEIFISHYIYHEYINGLSSKTCKDGKPSRNRDLRIKMLATIPSLKTIDKLAIDPADIPNKLSQDQRKILNTLTVDEKITLKITDQDTSGTPAEQKVVIAQSEQHIKDFLNNSKDPAIKKLIIDILKYHQNPNHQIIAKAQLQNLKDVSVKFSQLHKFLDKKLPPNIQDSFGPLAKNIGALETKVANYKIGKAYKDRDEVIEGLATIFTQEKEQLDIFDFLFLTESLHNGHFIMTENTEFFQEVLDPIISKTLEGLKIIALKDTRFVSDLITNSITLDQDVWEAGFKTELSLRITVIESHFQPLTTINSPKIVAAVNSLVVDINNHFSASKIVNKTPWSNTITELSCIKNVKGEARIDIAKFNSETVTIKIIQAFLKKYFPKPLDKGQIFLDSKHSNLEPQIEQFIDKFNDNDFKGWTGELYGLKNLLSGGACGISTRSKRSAELCIDHTNIKEFTEDRLSIEPHPHLPAFGSALESASSKAALGMMVLTFLKQGAEGDIKGLGESVGMMLAPQVASLGAEKMMEVLQKTVVPYILENVEKFAAAYGSRAASAIATEEMIAASPVLKGIPGVAARLANIAIMTGFGSGSGSDGITIVANNVVISIDALEIVALLLIGEAITGLDILSTGVIAEEWVRGAIKAVRQINSQVALTSFEKAVVFIEELFGQEPAYIENDVMVLEFLRSGFLARLGSILDGGYDYVAAGIPGVELKTKMEWEQIVTEIPGSRGPGALPGAPLFETTCSQKVRGVSIKEVSSNNIMNLSPQPINFIFAKPQSEWQQESRLFKPLDNTILICVDPASNMKSLNINDSKTLEKPKDQEKCKVGAISSITTKIFTLDNQDYSSNSCSGAIMLARNSTTKPILKNSIPKIFYIVSPNSIISPEIWAENILYFEDGASLKNIHWDKKYTALQVSNILIFEDKCHFNETDAKSVPSFKAIIALGNGNFIKIPKKIAVSLADGAVYLPARDAGHITVKASGGSGNGDSRDSNGFASSNQDASNNNGDSSNNTTDIIKLYSRDSSDYSSYIIDFEYELRDLASIKYDSDTKALTITLNNNHKIILKNYSKGPSSPSLHFSDSFIATFSQSYKNDDIKNLHLNMQLLDILKKEATERIRGLAWNQEFSDHFKFKLVASGITADEQNVFIFASNHNHYHEIDAMPGKENYIFLSGLSNNTSNDQILTNTFKVTSPVHLDIESQEHIRIDLRPLYDGLTITGTLFLDKEGLKYMVADEGYRLNIMHPAIKTLDSQKSSSDEVIFSDIKSWAIADGQLIYKPHVILDPNSRVTITAAQLLRIDGAISFDRTIYTKDIAFAINGIDLIMFYLNKNIIITIEGAAAVIKDTRSDIQTGNWFNWLKFFGEGILGEILSLIMAPTKISISFTNQAITNMDLLETPSVLQIAANSISEMLMEVPLKVNTETSIFFNQIQQTVIINYAGDCISRIKGKVVNRDNVDGSSDRGNDSSSQDKVESGYDDVAASSAVVINLGNGATLYAHNLTSAFTPPIIACNDFIVSLPQNNALINIQINHDVINIAIKDAITGGRPSILNLLFQTWKTHNPKCVELLYHQDRKYFTAPPEKLDNASNIELLLLISKIYYTELLHYTPRKELITNLSNCFEIPIRLMRHIAKKLDQDDKIIMSIIYKLSKDPVIQKTLNITLSGVMKKKALLTSSQGEENDYQDDGRDDYDNTDLINETEERPHRNHHKEENYVEFNATLDRSKRDVAPYTISSAAPIHEFSKLSYIAVILTSIIEKLAQDFPYTYIATSNPAIINNNSKIIIFEQCNSDKSHSADNPAAGTCNAPNYEVYTALQRYIIMSPGIEDLAAFFAKDSSLTLGSYIIAMCLRLANKNTDSSEELESNQYITITQEQKAEWQKQLEQIKIYPTSPLPQYEQELGVASGIFASTANLIGIICAKILHSIPKILNNKILLIPESVPDMLGATLEQLTQENPDAIINEEYQDLLIYIDNLTIGQYITQIKLDSIKDGIAWLVKVCELSPATSEHDSLEADLLGV